MLRSQDERHVLEGPITWNSHETLGLALPQASILAKLTLAWAAIICLQSAVGAATVLSNKAADLATAHVLLGALGLLSGTILSLAMFEGWTASKVAKPNRAQVQ